MTDRTKLELGGSILGDRLRDAGFSASLGIDDELLEKLVELAPQTRGTNPRDYHERFKDLSMAEAWHQQHDRIFYGLSSAVGNLVGAVWFSEDKWMGAQRTATIRAWKELRANPLRDVFTLLAHQHHEFELGYHGDIWTQSDASNLGEHRRFVAIGYHHTSGPNVPPPPDVPPHQLRFIRPYTYRHDEDSTAA